VISRVAVAVFSRSLEKENSTISQFSSLTILALYNMQLNNPLHGKTLEAIMVYLVSYYGWDELGDIIRINSFRSNPSIKSSLKFLRRTPWAREKVEKLYIETIEK